MYPTSARFRQVMAGSHRAVVRARIMSDIQFGASPTGGLELPLRSGNVKMSSTSDIKATLDCEVPGDYWEDLRPYGAEIFVERGVDFGDGSPPEYVPLGYYRVEEIQQASAPAGPIRVTAKDRLAQLKDVRLVYPYQYPAGLTHRVLFNRMVNGYTNPTGYNGGPLLISYGMYFKADVPIIFDGYDGDKATLPAGMVEDDIYEWMADVVDARGCVVTFDRLGRMVITNRDRDPSEPAVYAVKPGPGGNLISASRSLSRAGVYNIIVARGSDPAKATSYRLAYNKDTDSLLYWQGPFGPVPRHYSSPLLQDSDQAQLAANTLLTRYTGLPSGLATAILPDPSLDPLDPITVTVGTETQDHLIDELTIPVAGSNTGVQVVTRTKNEVPTEEDGGGAEEPGDGGGTGGDGDGGGDGGGDTGGPGGDPIYAAKFRDGVAFPNWTEPTSNSTVPVANTSELVSKLSAATGGQTLVLANGTYSPGILTSTKAATAAQPIVVKALNPGQVKFASGSGFSLRGKYILVKDIDKEFDDAGKSFALEGSAQFCGYEGVVVGPTSLAAAQPTATKSLHFYVGGDASDCFISYFETRNKSKPGNGVLVDGNFTSQKACRHILIDHGYFHDYGTEAVNDFEAIRYGVSTMQTTVVDAAIIRCVFERIKSEPEIISLKAVGIESWGHTARECIGSFSIRHGDDNFHQDCYAFGPATGANGTKAGGYRVYGKRNKIRWCYGENLNGDSYESFMTLDGGDTTSPTNAHQAIVGGDFSNNLAVNCTTGIVVGEHYSIAPSGIRVRDNVMVNSPAGSGGSSGGGSTPTARPLIGWGGNDGLNIAGVRNEIRGAFMTRDSWADLAGGRYLTDGPLPAYRTEYPDGAAMIGVPLIPHDSVSSSGWNALLDEAASGAQDATYRSLGAKLAEVTPKLCYARVWWEFNVENEGDINATKFKAAWNRAIPLIRQGFANAGGSNKTLRIVFCSMPDRTTKEALYPGSATVDVVSYDVYGKQYGATNPTKAAVISLTAGYLNDLKAWGASTGKPVAIDEWACWQVVSAGGTTNRGTGDHPEFITQIFDFATNPANNCAYLCYFNEPGGGVGITLADTPNARSVFVTRAQAVQSASSGSGSTGSTGSTTGTQPLRIVKAPTGTNDIGGNVWHPTTALAGLTLSGGAWRKTGLGPRLVKLEAADVGRAGPRTDGTGPSLGGTPGGGTGGTTPTKVQAAQLILNRFNSGQTILESWTWTGAPVAVTTHAPALLNQYKQEVGSYDFPTDIPTVKIWLQGFIDSGGLHGTVPGGGSATSPGAFLKFGKGPGLAKFDVGIGFAPGDDLGPNGDGVGKTGSAIHRNYSLAIIERGLTVPGYFELTSDRTAVRMSAHLDGGRTSTNTQYPRVEPREYDIDGVTKMAFDPNSGTHYIIHRFIVDRIPPDKPELVVCQYHDAPDDTAMIRFRNKTTVEAKLGDTVLGNVTTSHVLGQTYTTMIKIVGGTGADAGKCRLEFYWQDMASPKFTTGYAKRTTGWYGKAGCYAQSNSSIDAVEDGPFIIRTLGLGHWHSKSPLSSGPWPEPLGLKP